MDKRKSLLTRLAETFDDYRAELRTTQQSSGQMVQPNRLSRFLRWLTPNGGTLLLVALLIATAQVWARPLASTADAPGPSATTVNYQGRLADNVGVPLAGSYAMRFSLYDAVTGGSLIWGPEIHDAVPVSDGLFSVGLGSQTSGGIPTSVWNGDRYLEITVGGETLSPRELIRSVPIAGMALTVPDGAIGTEQIADGAVTQGKAPTLIGGQVNNALMRWGNEVITTDAQGVGTIDFSTAFPSASYAVVANNGDRGAADFTIQIDGKSATKFFFKVFSLTGTPMANKTVRIFYIAVGD